MNIQKIKKQYAILALLVCLFAALTLSYKVFAAESEKKAEKPVKTKVEKVEEKEVGEKKRAEEKRKLAEKERVKKEEEKKKAVEKKEKGKKFDKKSQNAFKIKMTDKDLTNLYRLVQSEVGYMDEKSKLLVASVVLNRVKSKKFPDTVSGVVLQKLGKVYQFSPVAPGKRFWTCTVSAETKAAVDKVLKNGDYSKGALYFVAKKYTKKGWWFDKHLAWLHHHEGQDYYKER